jgi:Cu(I)/Ag(I) efflux system membrane fusion protein
MIKGNVRGKDLALIALALLCLLLLFRGGSSAPAAQQTAAHPQASNTIWTCSMHPQIRLPEPGSCPICGMDLIPAGAEGDGSGPWELRMSEGARKLAEIQTSVVVRAGVPHERRLVGKIEVDEKRLRTVSARVAGRIDRLFVDFTGISVEKGDHMVEIYSPELVTALQELRQAQSALQQGPEAGRPSAERRLAATRRKLALLGLSPEQLEQLAAAEGNSTNLTLQAPIGGIVLQKHVNEGVYVEMGTPIYSVADLSRVWVSLQAYESDLPWLRFGQPVRFEVEAYPGEQFSGRISFIDPMLNPQTRTVRVRLEMANAKGLLKPDMFVRAVVMAALSPTGKVLDPALAGMWLCRMHPEISAKSPGLCDVCGMDLVRPESLGFETGASEEDPLVVPASAVLLTGTRSVVYVEGEPGSFQGRVVTLGPRAGDRYVVRSGLTAGEKVVTHGAFKIDSELQIRAKHSMLYPPQEAAGPAAKTALSEEQTATLQVLLQGYFAVQRALSEDALPAARSAAQRTENAISAALISDPGQQDTSWRSSLQEWPRLLKNLDKSENLPEARRTFETLSGRLIALLQAFGVPPAGVVYQFHCPMAAANQGADWLQGEKELANPYFGAAMLACGSLVRELRSPAEGGSSHE